MQQSIILFDINETVLDLSSLKEPFTAVFGSPESLPLWFARLLHTSTVCITTGVKSDFATLAGISLNTVATHFGVTLSAEQRSKLLSGFAHLSPHADIKPSLIKLREHGFRTVAFSNSSSSLIQQQIENAGLTPYFDHIVSVESTGSFKPDPNVYAYVAKTLEAPSGQLRLVATHDWDTHGALSAGLQAAYIARSKAVYNPLYQFPDIHGATMGEIVDKIIQQAGLM